MSTHTLLLLSSSTNQCIPSLLSLRYLDASVADQDNRLSRLASESPRCAVLFVAVRCSLLPSLHCVHRRVRCVWFLPFSLRSDREQGRLSRAVQQSRRRGERREARGKREEEPLAASLYGSHAIVPPVRKTSSPSPPPGKPQHPTDSLLLAQRSSSAQHGQTTQHETTRRADGRARASAKRDDT